MKIIVTGATGSLGASMVRYFAGKGHEIIASGRDKEPPAALLKHATYFPADITKPFRFPDADVCIHTAALSDDKAKLRDLIPANVDGTRHVIEAAAACRKFIHISSSSVYLPDEKHITEDMAGKQNNKLLSPYGLSKLLAEEKVREIAGHDSCFILRPRAFYGAGDRVILPRILKLVKKETFQPPGKMQVNVSLTHYTTIAHAIECCFTSDKKETHTYNVADEPTYVLVDVVRKIIGELYGNSLPEKEVSIGLLKLLSLFKIGGITPLLVRSFTQDMVLDTTKIKTELKFNPSVHFDAQLHEMGDWVRSIGGVEAIREGNRKLAWQ